MSRSKAIVIGAGMGGLAAARVLSDHFDHVQVLERDELPEEPASRRGVPQGRHAHALLVAGQNVLDGFFPGIVDEVVAPGGIRVRSHEGWWFQAGSYRVRAYTGMSGVSMSRPLLESEVRRRVASLDNVTLTKGVSVRGPVVRNDRVVGVVTDHETIDADLVVDCSGRHTRLVDQLADLGYPAPDESHIKIDMAYGTRILERDADFDGSFAVVVGNPRGLHRVAVLLPLESDRWILTLAGFHGDVPPTDEPGYLEFARSLPTPLIADVLERAEPLSPVMTHRMPTSQRRHFENLRQLPGGYLALGDAICSFNPTYGQGMSSAALQALALGESLRRHRANDASLARDFYRRAARVIDNPWAIAAGADFANPQTTGPRSPGTDVKNRYIAKVLLACHTSPEVATAMWRVQNLLEPPTSLLRPGTMIRAFRAARKSPVVTGVPGPRPVVRPRVESTQRDRIAAEA